MSAAPDVAVVGGGVIGCAAAWYLARAGARVALYERGALAGEATAASAGILAPLAESVAPGPFAELALAGLRAFAEDIDALRDDSGLDPEYRVSGVVRLATDEAAAAHLRQAAVWQAGTALDLRWLEPRQVAALEPGLAPCAGALLSSLEGHVNPPRLTAALAVAAARRGAALHEHCPPPVPWLANGRVRGLLVGDERIAAGTVVLAAGAWSGAWAAPLGLTIPVRPVKGQMLLLRALPPPVRRVVFAGHGYLVPRVDGTVYVGATQEEAGYDRRVTAAGVAELIALATAMAPTLRAAEVVRMGAGLRPGTADGLPVIGPAPAVDGLVVATGHFRNGVLMSLITGRIVAALIAGSEPETPITAFSPARFAPAGEPGRGR
jgi:glycine oxidase